MIKIIKKIINFFKIPKDMYATDSEADYFNKNFNRVKWVKRRDGSKYYYVKDKTFKSK